MFNSKTFCSTPLRLAGLLVATAAFTAVSAAAADVQIQSFEDAEVGAAMDGEGAVVAPETGATDGEQAMQLELDGSGQVKVFHTVIDNAFFLKNPGVGSAKGLVADITYMATDDSGTATLYPAFFGFPEGEQGFEPVDAAVTLKDGMKAETVSFMFDEKEQGFYDKTSNAYLQIEFFTEAGSGASGTLTLDNVRLVSEAPAAESDDADDAE